MKIRLPMSKKTGKAIGTKKGKKGYRRKGRRVVSPKKELTNFFDWVT